MIIRKLRLEKGWSQEQKESERSCKSYGFLHLYSRLRSLLALACRLKPLPAARCSTFSHNLGCTRAH